MHRNLGPYCTNPRGLEYIRILERGWTHQEFLPSPRVTRYLNSSIEFCCSAGTQSHRGQYHKARAFGISRELEPKTAHPAL
jgi:hypothetical protein